MRETFSYFDREHWSKVQRERRRLGLPSWEDADRYILDHPWVGKLLRDNKTRAIYLIERVSKDFLCGLFLQMLVSNNGSHRVIWFSNISSTAPEVLERVEAFDQDFTLLN